MSKERSDENKRLDALMDQVIQKNQGADTETLVDCIIADYANELIALDDAALIWALVPETTRKFIIRDRYYARRPAHVRSTTNSTTNRTSVTESTTTRTSNPRATVYDPGWPERPNPASSHQREMEILSRNVGARYENEKILLNRIMVIELGKPLGECTFGDIRSAHVGSSRRTRFYELILEGRETFSDDLPILGNIAPSEIEGFEKMAA